MSLKYEPSSEPLHISAPPECVCLVSLAGDAAGGGDAEAGRASSSLLLSSLELSDTQVYAP